MFSKKIESPLSRQLETLNYYRLLYPGVNFDPVFTMVTAVVVFRDKNVTIFWSRKTSRTGDR